ncbi:phosphohydrolase [Lottiidibacillus patelloidae]|uniref:Phosphohydrolase n=1 Tax=Lottiidibacillus patelloidae TaxID=2670334 RepID=A0A263BUM7_9BACI|nr:HD domain-containing protein [Lottiidibacillus patelloidae]OZM57429.1 phosphohydrolase [Lottiidibacillus patelloidae]
MNEIIHKAEQFAKEFFLNDSSGHDWYHTDRVRKTALKLAKEENADVFICEMAALLHDVADEKMNDSEAAGLEKVRKWLAKHNEDEKQNLHIINIISSMSFKGGNSKGVETVEGKVVQDADRLDAIGAIGIARTFAYSGAKGQAMYDPTIPVRTDMTKEQYRNEKSSAINHFYEKLFKLKDLLNTRSAKQLAEEKHAFMVEFVTTFLDEWEQK